MEVLRSVFRDRSREIHLHRTSVPSGFHQHGVELPSTANHRGLRTIDDYKKLEKIGNGSYGTVFRAQDKETGEEVAVKRVDRDKLAMREIDALCSQGHPSLIHLKEVFLTANSVFLVMELADRDLGSLIRDKTIVLDENAIRRLLFQILQGVAHLHRLRILHRDLKPQNLLLIRRPDGSNQVRIGDFGLSKRYNGHPGHYSRKVGTLRYRAPELLAGHEFPESSPAIDIWAVGCIFAELLCRRPLFHGKTEMDQYFHILKFFGSGFDKLREIIPPSSLSDDGFDLLTRLLDWNPETRITAAKALVHPWFSEDLLRVEMCSLFGLLL